ncbi:hypothetical protein AcV7_001630 [Taiwanofungus camphoratus]|nr:hypothetical protein AcV7_001630 [Antrodia cinnamomea]
MASKLFVSNKKTCIIRQQLICLSSLSKVNEGPERYVFAQCKTFSKQTFIRMISSRMLPPELHDYIIDFLWDSHSALAACSLTCRAWLPSTRAHLFHSVKLRSSQDSIRLENLLNAGSFQWSTSPANYVRDLYILGGGRSQAQLDWEIERRLPSLLPRLSKVERLVLSRFSWAERHGLREETMRCILTFSPMIKALVFDTVTFERPHDVALLLSAYPRLRAVIFWAVTWDTSIVPGAPGLPLHPGLGRGELRMDSIVLRDMSSYAEIVVDWLLRTPIELPLRKLTWTNYIPTRQAILRDLLQRSGPNLEYLRLGLCLTQQALAQDSDIGLSNNTQLISLDIDCLSWEGSYSWVHIILSEIDSPRLQTVMFNFVLYRRGESGLDFLHWEFIDEALVHLGRQLPGLTVNFRFIDPKVPLHLTPSSEVVAAVTERLPRSRSAAAAAGLVMMFSAREYKRPRAVQLLQ